MMHSLYDSSLRFAQGLPGVGHVMRWVPLFVRMVLKDKLFLRASALTYTTVLSIVPFLAVAFSVLKGFGIQNTDFIRDLLLRVAAGREQVVDHIITYINQTNVRTLGVVGVGFLFVTAIMLISNIENTLNSLWGVHKGRSWVRKFTDYVSTIFVVPIFTVVAISVSATLQNNTVVRNIAENAYFGPIYMTALSVLPFVLIWLVLAFLYLLLPNTKVRLLPAVFGAVIAGSVWQIAQWGYITFQVGAAKYNAIYGSFAQLPLFLVWVYMSWVIVLMGAELVFMFQNAVTVEMESRYADASPAEKIQLALQALVRMGLRFMNGDTPPDLRTLCTRLHAPVTLMRSIFFRLSEAGLVARVDDEEREVYMLRNAPETMRILDVVRCFMHGHGEALPLRQDSLYAPLRGYLSGLEEVSAASGQNKTLRALVEEAQGLAEDNQ